MDYPQGMNPHCSNCGRPKLDGHIKMTWAHGAIQTGFCGHAWLNELSPYQFKILKDELKKRQDALDANAGDL